MQYQKLKELQAILKTLRPLNQTELIKIRENFLIENTYNSNAIEGNSLTLRETAIIINEGITIAKKPIKEHLEVIGHKQALEYVYQIAKNTEKLTETVIKEIHLLVLMNDNQNGGKYRQINVEILGSKQKTSQHFEISHNMQELLKKYHNSKEEPIKKISDFHIDFETIHPFIDGNGRSGRLILNLELIKNGFLPINIKFSDVENYYNAFESKEKMQKLITQYQIEELEKYITNLT